MQLSTPMMNNRLEFRCLYEGEWHYATLDEITSQIGFDYGVPENVKAFIEGKHKTQWTGMTDNKGKDIYGFDILEAYDEHEEFCSCEHCFNVRKGDRVVVVWLDGGFRLYPAEDYMDYFGKDNGHCEWCNLVSENLISPNHEIEVSGYFNVIGDVFTTPELLNKR